jgi:hypothetical protein
MDNLFYHTENLLKAATGGAYYAVRELDRLLKMEVCDRCGNYHRNGSVGLWEILTNECFVNKFIYRPGTLTLRQLTNVIMNIDPLASFKGLADSSYFKPMKNVDTATALEKRQYFMLRQLDIKWLLIINGHMKEEDEMNSRW